MSPNLIPAFAALVFAVAERFPSLRFRKSPLLRRYILGDVVYLLTGFVAGASLAIAYVVAASEAFGATLGVPRLAELDLPLWVAAPLALVALDFGNYLSHYLLHRVGVLWEFHKVHHSIETLDWMATFRSHVVEQAFRRLLAPVLLIVVGLPLDAVALAAGVFVAWAMLNHSNLRVDLGALERVLITPRLHRLHHVPGTDDRNLGTMLTIWDRLRGTLVLAEVDPHTAFGLPAEALPFPQGWLLQLAEPFRAIARSAQSPAGASPPSAGASRESAASDSRPYFR